MLHNKIYTRNGDKGRSSIIGGASIPKDSQIFELLGGIDELDAMLGVAKSIIDDQKIKLKLTSIQEINFLISSELANISSPRKQEKVISEDEIKLLESDIDSWDSKLEPLKNFIIPGENITSAYLHLSRATCRRVERTLVSYSNKNKTRSELLTYFNRLSDWLFMLARVTSTPKETIWSI